MTNTKRTRKTNANATANDNHPREYGPIGDLVAGVLALLPNGRVSVQTVCRNGMDQREVGLMSDLFQKTLDSLPDLELDRLGLGGKTLLFHDRESLATFWMPYSVVWDPTKSKTWWDIFKAYGGARFKVEEVGALIFDALTSV